MKNDHKLITYRANQSNCYPTTLVFTNSSRFYENSVRFIILRRQRRYSHSIVAGGLLLMSYTTRFTPATSLTMRLLMRPRTS